MYTTYENTKARGLVQNGGPPGSLEESGPAGVILYEMDGPYRLAFTPYRTGCPDRSHPAAILWNFQPYTTICHEQRHARKIWTGTLRDPCFSASLWTLHYACTAQCRGAGIIVTGTIYFTFRSITKNFPVKKVSLLEG